MTQYDGKRIIVLDLETKRLFEDVGGGYKQNHLLGISVCGVYDSLSNTYKSYHENELLELIPLFKSCDLVVGFNSISFDFAVLQAYMPHFNLSKVPHLDILVDVTKAVGHRLKLESLAQATLLSGKSGVGTDAVRFYRMGDFASLDKYCLDDVKITRMIYDYGLRHGCLWYTQGGQKTSIPVKWSSTPTITEQLHTAYTAGNQVGITYLVPEEARVHEFWQHVIDIQSIKDNKVTAWCHTLEKQMIYDINFILDINIIGKMQAFQASLI